MKKLCIIGSSNTLIYNGYGYLCKQELGDQCDIYGLGSSNITFALITLLQEDIVNNYEYVLIEFNPVDSGDVLLNYINIESVISAFFQIFKFFNNKNSHLGLLILNSNIELGGLYSYIPRTLASIYNVPIIDIELSCIFVDYPALMPDKSHYAYEYAIFIKNEIFKFINENNKYLVQPKHNFDINYTLLDINQYSDLEKSVVGTRLTRKQVYKLSDNKCIILPQNKFLCGILYWSHQGRQLLQYHNNIISLEKNLTSKWENLFLCRSIGHSIYYGIKGGEIKAVNNLNQYLKEPTLAEKQDIPDGHSQIFINTLLLCDRPPSVFGNNFYRYYFKKFMMELNKQLQRYQFVNSFSTTSFFKRLDIYFSGGGFILHLLKHRVDLIKEINIMPPFDMSNEDYSVERFLLWCWTYGCKEVAEINEVRNEIANALLKICETNNTNCKQFFNLMLAIKSMRPDLSIFDHNSLHGINELETWFFKHGITEYGLEEIVSTYLHSL